jgi:flavin-dependent dehydrogenase
VVIAIHVDIVGGSLSGLSAAISLKQHDKTIDVIVYEKYKKIGYNPEGRRCGEAHSVESEWIKWRPTGKSIFNEISTVITYYGDKQKVLHRLPGTSCILNRQEFIYQLGNEAEKRGVTLQTNHKIKSISELTGDIIIDASGCPSTIKRELGIDQGMRGMTYQETLEDANCFIGDTVKILVMGSIGYYWLFPRDPDKQEVNVGIGVVGRFDGNLKELLALFKQTYNIDGKLNYVLGGPIPTGLQRPLMHKNILFVGDAGVGAFPLTGQGIYRALLSGDIAGHLIAHGHEHQYPHIINQKFIKWDIIGKSFIWMNQVLHKIGEKPVLLAAEYLNRFHGALQ